MKQGVISVPFLETDSPNGADGHLFQEIRSCDELALWRPTSLN